MEGKYNTFWPMSAKKKRKSKPSSVHTPCLVFNTIFTHSNRISKNIMWHTAEEYVKQPSSDGLLFGITQTGMWFCFDN